MPDEDQRVKNLLTLAKVEAALAAMPVTLNREVLEEMRKNNLLSYGSYLAFRDSHLKAQFDEEAPGLIDTDENARRLYEGGEMVALAFLTAGDRTKRVITGGGLNNVCRQYAQPIMESKLFAVLVKSFERQGGFIDSHFTQLVCSPILGSLYALQKPVCRAGYSGIVAAAIESLADLPA